MAVDQIGLHCKVLQYQKDRVEREEITGYRIDIIADF
jgi:hypothetical protein